MSPFRASAALTKHWENFRVDITDGVVRITLNRPDKLNALTFEAYADLRDLLAELPHRDDAPRVVVITGEGRGFCSGGDVEEIIGELQKMDVRELLEFTRMTGSVVRGIRDCPLPVIAAVNGIAAGAGAVIALACDLRLLAESAKFAFLFTRVGLAGADMGSAYLLPRIVGLQKAKELAFSARIIEPEEARALGIVYDIVGEGEAVSQAVALANRFRNASSLAIAMTKNMLNQSFEHDLQSLLELEASAQAIANNSDYHRSAVARFLDKQPTLFDWEKQSG